MIDINTLDHYLHKRILKIQTYHNTPNLPKLTWIDFVPKNDNTSLEHIEKLITNQITKQITSEDSKISLALSGGVDSTLVLSIIRKKFPKIPIEAISIKFADSLDESESARKIAEHFDADHSVIFLENYLLELPKAISITNRPFWDLHWYYIVKKADSVSNYLVGGDGGDELFGGYSFRYSKLILEGSIAKIFPVSPTNLLSSIA